MLQLRDIDSKTTRYFPETRTIASPNGRKSSTIPSSPKSKSEPPRFHSNVHPPLEGTRAISHASFIVSDSRPEFILQTPERGMEHLQSNASFACVNAKTYMHPCSCSQVPHRQKVSMKTRLSWPHGSIGRDQESGIRGMFDG